MNNRILKFIFWGIIIVSNQSCLREEIPSDVDLGVVEEIVSIESFVIGSIQGVSIDTLFLDCENSIKLTRNSVIQTDNSFVMIQGIKFEVNDNMTIWGNIYIYDEIKKPNLLSTEILKTYIDFSPEKIMFDLEITTNNEIYRNHSIDSQSFLENIEDKFELIADNQVLLIETKSPFVMNCYGELDILQIMINYSGVLKTIDETKSIVIDNLGMKINLREL